MNDSFLPLVHISEEIHVSGEAQCEEGKVTTEGIVAGRG
jgi:hypothetical protein